MTLPVYDPVAFNPVPCNGCTECCKLDAVELCRQEYDKYRSMPHPFYKGARAIMHKPGGGCIYLTDAGCSIQSDKPYMCRTMDCRVLTRRITFADAKRYRVVKVWRRGQELTRQDKRMPK